MTTCDRDKLLARIKAGLEDAFGGRFRGLVLFGSEARGTARPDSDIDLLVLLDGKTDIVADTLTAARVICPIELEMDPPRLIDATPANFEEFQDGKWPLYRVVRREGIAA